MQESCSRLGNPRGPVFVNFVLCWRVNFQGITYETTGARGSNGYQRHQDSIQIGIEVLGRRGSFESNDQFFG